MGISPNSAGEELDSVEAAFREVGPFVREMARKAGLSEPDQREVVQKVGLVLVEKFDQYEPSKGSWREWAAGIARNFLLGAQRDARTDVARRELAMPVNRLPAWSLTPEQELRAREALAIVSEAIREEHRAAFALHVLGCSTAEIGRALKMPRTAVEWHLKEARKDVRRALARLRETEDEAARVRGVVWPFAVVTDVARKIAAHVFGDRDATCARAEEASRPDPARLASKGAALRSRVVRALLVATVPALLSVHLVRRPSEPAALLWVGEHMRGVAAAAHVDELPPPAATIGDPGARSCTGVVASPPNDARRAVKAPASRFGGQPVQRFVRGGGVREWMAYKEIVHQALQHAPPSATGPRAAPSIDPGSAGDPERTAAGHR